MRIPGIALRTPVTITPKSTSRGDGDVLGTPVTVRGVVDHKTVIVNDTTGKTLVSRVRVRVRATVQVGEIGRRPQVGDTMTVGGKTRQIGEVDEVTGPGSQVSYLELVAADG